MASPLTPASPPCGPGGDALQWTVEQRYRGRPTAAPPKKRHLMRFPTPGVPTRPAACAALALLVCTTSPASRVTPAARGGETPEAPAAPGAAMLQERQLYL